MKFMKSQKTSRLGIKTIIFLHNHLFIFCWCLFRNLYPFFGSR